MPIDINTKKIGPPLDSRLVLINHLPQTQVTSIGNPPIQQVKYIYRQPIGAAYVVTKIGMCTGHRITGIFNDIHIHTKLVITRKPIVVAQPFLSPSVPWLKSFLPSSHVLMILLLQDNLTKMKILFVFGYASSHNHPLNDFKLFRLSPFKAN